MNIESAKRVFEVCNNFQNGIVMAHLNFTVQNKDNKK